MCKFSWQGATKIVYSSLNSTPQKMLVKYYSMLLSIKNYKKKKMQLSTVLDINIIKVGFLEAEKFCPIFLLLFYKVRGK